MTTYRVGRRQPQNLYRDDQYIGVMFTAEDAEMVVEALNGAGGVETYACPHCGDDIWRGDSHACVDVEPAPSAETIASILAIVDAPYRPGLDFEPEGEG